jgi:hypothetical protein
MTETPEPVQTKRSSKQLKEQLLTQYAHFLLVLGLSPKELHKARGFMKHGIERIVKRAQEEARNPTFDKTASPGV